MPRFPAKFLVLQLLFIAPLHADLAWLDFQAGANNTSPLYRAVPSVSGNPVTGGGLTFTLGGTGIDARDRVLADPMLSDFVFIDGDGATMTLLIQGLPAGTYAVDSYHYDGGGFAGAVRVESHPQANPANNTVVLANFAYATTPASYTFTTDGSPHELLFRENDTNNRLRLNGLKIRASGTIAGPPGSFIDISASNTAAVGGTPSPFSTDDLNAAGFTSGNLWRRRTGFGFSVTSAREIYEKDANGGVGNATTLVTTATGLVPGKTYGVHVGFLSVPTETWQVKGGLTANSLELFTPATPVGRIANIGLSAESASNRNQYLGFIGNAVAAPDGTLQLFADDGDGTATNWTTRTWLEGFLLGDPVITPPLPGDGIEIAPDGAWTWFNDERAIVHQGSLFSGYVKTNGTFGITRHDLTTGENFHMIISTATSQQQDDHDNPSITALPDGKLMVLYSKHIAGSRFFQRTSLVPLPTTNADWGPEIIITMPAANTYANTYRLSGESNAIYDFSRCINFNPTLTISTDNGATWGTSRQLVGTGSGNTRPYPRYCSNGVDRIDLIYTDGHPRDVENSVYHMYYKNGGLYKTDGTLIDSLVNIPLDHDAGKRGNVIYPFSNNAWGVGNGPDDWIPTGRGWTWDVQYGAEGMPTCVFQVQTGTDATWSTSRVYYYYARWTGTTWQRKFIAQAGRGIYAAESDYGGGMCLDPEDPRIVYISTNAANPFSLGDIDNVPLRANNRYEIYRGFTTDGGLTFTWTQITVDSTNDNLRPIVPPDHGRREFLLWFNGTYTSYTSFSTKVLARIGEPVVSYADWAAGSGLAANSGSGDGDHDGQSNFLEYALSSNPLNGQSRAITAWNGSAFQFAIDRSRADVEWVVSHSTDLENWQTAAVVRSAGLPGSVTSGFTAEVPDDTGAVKVSIQPLPAGGKSFFRLTAKSAR